MKTLFICLFSFMTINSTTTVEKVQSFDCDEIAEDFYYDTLNNGGSQQQATDAYGQAFDVCWRHYEGTSDLEVEISN